MIDEVLTVSDVYRSLLERLSAGRYAPGTKLPSCRALAEELGSNPSTVDRALKRLVEVGLVRTVPRRGSFVVQAGTAAVHSRDEIADELGRVLAKAWRSGIVLDDIRQLVAQAVGQLEESPKVAFVECNRRDLDHMHALVREATGIEVQPVLIDDAWGRRLDEEFDVVTTPIFHLDDLGDIVTGFDRVVEVNFVASQSVMRRLVALRSAPRMVAAAPTARGVSWMTALVGQYYAGAIEPFHIGVDDPSRLVGADVVVMNNAARLPDGWETRVPEIVSVEWELDPRFAGTFRGRIDEVLAARATAAAGASSGPVPASASLTTLDPGAP
ncbi:winged helix-turn-helix domain-containing protein [Herbiconiux moechotypicola]|uniref:HTH gntR-type domain-containing protein n=1 Tax=Herbiconiux moechotypicola TaxID=637393 RepID=A0ABP5QIY0_9MICO|nr:winged helix-turn-helix domain-containing protein [Herbiconiux moechotypicola]MCS5730076.1 winged helix-turn-helix domain-containing protein [Herbiconiux moechotypicola]